MELLKTKFHIPVLSEHNRLIFRESLVSKFSKNADKNLIIVRAPAGFGKTTFLSQCLENRSTQSKICWFSIDESDNHPARFWAYFFGSIHQQHPRLCRSAMMQLESLDGIDTEEIIISGINDIETFDAHFTMVLDDYHLIRSKQIHKDMGFFIDHPIRNLQLVISTRHKPQLELSRLLLSGRLYEMDETDLKFSEDEALAFLEKGPKHDLNRTRKKKLIKKTEGWVAALKLFSMVFNDDGGGDKALVHSNRFFHDYMWAEVFDRFADDLKAFLVDVSIFDRFNRDACRYLTQDPRTEYHLNFLIENQFFIVCLDSGNHWFRFHHLFLDFLRTQFKKIPLEKQQDLHFKAFQYFESVSLFEEAFSHAAASGRGTVAAALFARHIAGIYGRGSDESVSEYFSRLTETDIFSQPVLIGYYLGFQIYSGNFNLLKKFGVLKKNFQDKNDQRIIEGFRLAFLAYENFYVKGELEKTIDLAQKALEFLPAEHGAFVRMLDYMQTISYRYTGQIKKAISLSKFRQDEDLLTAVLSATNIADLDLELGRLKAAEETLKKHIRMVEDLFEHAAPPSIFGFLYVMMGKLLTEKNQLDPAMEAFSKGLSILRKTRFIELTVISLGEYALFLSICKQFLKAHKVIDDAIHLSRQNPSWVESLLLAGKARIWIREKKADPAAFWANAFKVAPDFKIPFIQSHEYLVLARYFIETRNFEKAEGILDQLIKKDLEDQRFGRLIEGYVVKSKLLLKSGRRPQAKALIKKAFELSRHEGQVMTYLEDLEGMKDLYRECDRDGILPAYLEPHFNFLKSQEKSNENKTLVIHDYIEAFNAREIDLLKLFQKGVSNKEAAQTLCLSVNTVRWYASRIFAKLDVKRRGQAVSKAVKLDLI